MVANTAGLCINKKHMPLQHYLHTGQRTCHADDGHAVPCANSGQDASFAVGVSWPEPRFALCTDEVTDNLTGLVP